MRTKPTDNGFVISVVPHRPKKPGGGPVQHSGATEPSRREREIDPGLRNFNKPIVTLKMHSTATYGGLSKYVFDWADSYDQKDWDRLRGISAAQLKVEYREILGPDSYWPEMSLDDFIAKMSDPKFLGDPFIRTQHLIGATWWERISETEVIGHHQIRAAHLRFKDESLTEEIKRGHSHATNDLYYRKLEGTWKFAGLAPSVLFNEFDFNDIFQSHT
ncbi:Scytalone dehydratase [Penicillium sp. IBT 35674x]|nr:Scytalone dehydratase [Penicillium sp. IBT 35674x]